MEKAYLSIQEIRKVGNRPLEIFGLNTNELSLSVKLFGLSFLVGVFLQVLSNLLLDGVFVLYYGFLLFVFGIWYIKHLNKKLGKGMAFFYLAKFTFKHKDNKTFKSVLKHTNL